MAKRKGRTIDNRVLSGLPPTGQAGRLATPEEIKAFNETPKTNAQPLPSNVANLPTGETVRRTNNPLGLTDTQLREETIKNLTTLRGGGELQGNVGATGQTQQVISPALREQIIAENNAGVSAIPESIPVDPRGALARTFLPTKEQGEARRLASFGTTDKAPAIATALAVGGLVGAGGTLLGGLAGGTELGASIGAKLGGAQFSHPANVLFARISASSTATKVFAGAVGLPTIAGIYNKLGSDRKEAVNTAKSNFSASTKNLAFNTNEVNKQQISKNDALAMWDFEVQNIIAQEQALRILMRKDLKFFIESNGGGELALIEGYIRTLPQRRNNLIVALDSPNPLAPEEVGVTFEGLK